MSGASPTRPLAFTAWIQTSPLAYQTILVLRLYGNVFTEKGCEGPYELVRFIRHSDEITGWTSEKMGLDFRKCRDISLSSLRPDLWSKPSLLSNGYQTSPQG